MLFALRWFVIVKVAITFLAISEGTVFIDIVNIKLSIDLKRDF